MKEQYELSGIYFRQQNKDTGKWENVCFEDLELDKQKDIVALKEPEFVGNLAIELANVLNKVAKECNVRKGELKQ